MNFSTVVLRRTVYAAALCCGLGNCGGSPDAASEVGSAAQDVRTGNSSDHVVHTGSINGKITDVSGSGLGGVALFGERLDVSGRPVIVSTAVTNAQGCYTMTLLPIEQTYYVVSRPYVNGVIYDPEASGALQLSSDAPTARYSVALDVSNGVGSVSGNVMPGAASNESDQLNLVSQFSPGGSAWLLVDTTLGQIFASETYSFASEPVGMYAVWATRSMVQQNGTISVTAHGTSQPFDIVAGAAVNADVQYP